MVYVRGFIRMFGTYSTESNREEWKSFLFEWRTTGRRDDEGGGRRVASRVSPGGVGFVSVSIGSRVFRERVRTVYWCITYTTHVTHHVWGGMDGWNGWMECDGWNGLEWDTDGWNGTH